MPPEFTFPADRASTCDRPDLWIPVRFSQQELDDRAGSFGFDVIARLRSGVALKQANEDVRRALTTNVVKLNAGVERWNDEDARAAKPVLMLLFAAVSLILLIACANVAHLLIARSSTREREMTLRVALGASTARLLRQSITESLALASIGGLIGLVVTWILTRWIGRVANLDWRYAGIAVALTILAGVGCGVAPAWHRRGNLGLNVSRALGVNRRRQRLQRFLVVAEAACTMTLLASAGMLVHSLWRVLHTPLGFNPERVLVVRTSFNRQRYPSTDVRRVAQQAILATVSAVPGVETVGMTTNLPLAGAKPITYRFPGESLNALRPALAELIDDQYFRALQIPLLAGRSFDSSDRPRTQPVAIVNETLARGAWAGQSALGRRLIWAQRELTIVGVVGDVHSRALDRDVEPTVYLPIFQAESVATVNATIVVRATLVTTLASTIRAAVRQAHPDAVIGDVLTMSEVVATSLASRRKLVLVVTGFSGVALFLAMVGLFGLLAYQVAERTPEIGLRMALGALPRDLIRSVVTRSLLLSAGGLGAGLVACILSRPLLAAFLYQLDALDPVSLVFAALALLSTAALAAFVPARRAASVDPIIALRSE